MDALNTLQNQVTEITNRMNELSAARDTAVNISRQVVRSSANAIRALHRGESADTLITAAKRNLAEVVAATKPFPSVYWAGYVQDAMKEFAEAAIMRALLLQQDISSPAELDVEDVAWLNGLAEAGSELRRDILDALRHDETERAEYFLSAMDHIYGLLITVDFPDSVTGGLRRTTDQFRAVLERTRGDVTLSLRQTRLERALTNAEKIISQGG